MLADVFLQLLALPGGKPKPGDCVEVFVDDGWWRTRVFGSTAAAVTAPVGSATNIVTVPLEVSGWGICLVTGL